jgi:transposase
MGRSRGGLTTKIHALVDANGLPIALKLSQGQAHDGKSAQDMLTRLKPGQILLADRAYDSDALRQDVASQGAWANIKPMPGRVRIPAFSAFLYRYRNLVERFFSKLKHFRAIATRFEKHDANYLALIKLASARIWMRSYESVTYSDRERAALAWTEAVTLVAETHIPDDVYEEVRRHFTEPELVKLTMLIATINAWNRIAISFRSVHPVKPAAATA